MEQLSLIAAFDAAPAAAAGWPTATEIKAVMDADHAASAANGLAWVLASEKMLFGSPDEAYDAARHIAHLAPRALKIARIRKIRRAPQNVSD